MDYVADIALQEIALEGQSGVTLPSLWDLIEKRIGAYIYANEVKRAIWSRLCQFDGEHIVVHKKEHHDGLVSWPRITNPEKVPWHEVSKPAYIIKASVRLRVLALGMDIGTSGDPSQSAEVKKQAFRILQLIGQSRIDGVRQTSLTSRIGTDSSTCSLLLQYSESRNLISKLSVHGGKMIFIRRLTERKSWPLFYNGFGFLQGATASLKRSQALRLLHSSTPSLVRSMLVQYKGKCVASAKVVSSITTTVLKDMPGIVSILGVQRLRHVILLHIASVVTKDKDIVMQYLSDSNNNIVIVPAEQADPSLRVKNTFSTEAEEEDGDALKVSIYPNRSFLPSFLHRIIETPQGVLKSATLVRCSARPQIEAVMPDLQTMPGVEISHTNIGKTQHQVLYSRSEFLDAVRHTGNSYFSLHDPTLFPSSHVPPPEDPVTDAANNVMKQTVAFVGTPQRNNPNDRQYFLGSSYPSWCPSMGKVGPPKLQWKPERQPLSQEQSLNLTKTLDDKGEGKRILYWAGLNKNNAAPTEIQEKFAQSYTGDKSSSDAALGNLTSRFLKEALVEKLNEAKAISHYCVRSIVRESRLFKKIMSHLMKENICTHDVYTVQVLASTKTVDFYAVPGFERDSKDGKAFLEKLNSIYVKHTTVDARKKDEVEFVEMAVKNIKVPAEYAGDDVQELLFQLSNMNTLRVAKLKEQRETKAKLLVEVKRYIKTFWIIKNGFITSKMMSVQKLHDYLTSLTQVASFTIKDLVDGMTLKRFGRLIGMPVNVTDITEIEPDLWNRPVALQPKKLLDYIYSEGKGAKLLSHLKMCIDVLLYLGLLERKTRASHTLQDEYALASKATLKKIVSEEVQTLLKINLDFDFSTETGVTEYWERLRMVLCDETIDSKDLDLSVLGAYSRQSYTWDGGLPIQQITERRVNDYKKDKTIDSLTPIDAYKVSQLTNLNFAQSVSCLTENIQLLRTSVNTVHKTIGLRVVKEGKKRKLDKNASTENAKKKPRKKPSEKETLLANEEKEEDDVENSDSDDDTPRSVNRRPIWASAQQLVNLLDVVIRHSFHDGRNTLNTFSNKGLFLLKATKMSAVAEEMGWSEARLKTRWRYILGKPELKLLTEYAVLLREYNKKCEFDINTSLRSFMSESYAPCFQRGRRMPSNRSDFMSMYTIVKEQRFQPYGYKADHRPKVRASMEALKLLNMCPEARYDMVIAQGLMEGFCDSPDATALQDGLDAMTNNSHNNLLAKVRRAPGTRGRHFQLTQISEDCLNPRHRGLAHYQEMWGLAGAVDGKKSYTPHPVLSGGQVAYIVDELAAGSLSLIPQEYDGVQVNPMQTPLQFKRATIAKVMAAFFKNATRAQKVYYIPDGIMCAPSEKGEDVTLVAEVEQDNDNPRVTFCAGFFNLWKTGDEPVSLKKPLVRTAYEAFGDRSFDAENHEYIVTQAEHSETATLFDSIEDMSFSFTPEDPADLPDEATWIEPSEVPEEDHPIQLLEELVKPEWLDKPWNSPDGNAGNAFTKLLSTPEAVALYMPNGKACCPKLLKAMCALVLKAVSLSSSARGLRLSEFKPVILAGLREAAPDAPHGLADEVACYLTTPVSAILSSTKSVVVIPSAADGDDQHLSLAVGRSCLFPVQKVIAMRARNEYAKSTIKPAGMMRVAVLAVAAIAHVEMQGAKHAAIVAAVLAIVQLGSKLDNFSGGCVTVVGESKSKLGRKAKEILKGNVIDASTSEKNKKKDSRYRKDYASLKGQDGLESVARPMSALLTMEGSINHAVVARVSLALYDFLSVSPGSSSDALYEAFPFFSRKTIDDVLLNLQCTGVIRAEACPAPPSSCPASLFSDFNLVKMTECYYAIPGTVKKLVRVADQTHVEQQ
eukprot:TRINITY_DN2489_c0_g1_i1.p1 TRINITY_DN2489_c0_g1~~TRINITY_DN2489_c0_g1_i1.p1  ORF type:complete len:1860 (+),score=453.21 TRINITY_DN2489_c0_g1_i1:83-5662(+)